MDLRKIFGCIRFLIYLLEIFLLYSLERILIFDIGPFSISSLLIPSLVVFIALFEGEIFGLFFAIFGGFFLDFGFGLPLGIYAVVLGVFGYILGVLANYFINANFWIAWLFSCLMGALVINLRFFANYGDFIFGNASCISFKIYFSMIICTFLVSPLIILFNRLIFYYIRSKGSELL